MIFLIIGLVKQIKSPTFAPALGMKPNGALVQLVRISACHAGGHEFEPRTHRIFILRTQNSQVFFSPYWLSW